jgi:hypothetical protein
VIVEIEEEFKALEGAVAKQVVPEEKETPKKVVDHANTEEPVKDIHFPKTDKAAKPADPTKKPAPTRSAASLLFDAEDALDLARARYRQLLIEMDQAKVKVTLAAQPARLAVYDIKRAKEDKDGEAEVERLEETSAHKEATLERARGKLREIMKQLETAKENVEEEKEKVKVAKKDAEIEAEKVVGLVEDLEAIDEDVELELINTGEDGKIPGGIDKSNSFGDLLFVPEEDS